MNLVEFFQNLSAIGIELWVDADKLCYEAPEDVLTPELLTKIKQYKEEIIYLLQKRTNTAKTDPLSHRQKALWFLYELAPNSTAYNLAYAARLVSNVDIPALQQAAQALIERHPVLRTTYTAQHGEPVQTIHENQEVYFSVQEAANWSQDDFHNWLESESDRPFDLSNGPVLRFNLLIKNTLTDASPATEAILLMTAHHIVVDFWTLELLVSELKVLYQAIKTGSEVALPSQNLQYKDYVQWENQMLASQQGEQLWSYWRDQLAGELPILNLPTDRPRPPVQTYKGASHSFVLEEKLTHKLLELAKAEGVTLYTIVLAAFQVLLLRYTNQEDILIGSPMAGRSLTEFESIVGYFANPVVLRADLSGNPTFRELLRRVRSCVLGALEHQDYPFPLLVKRLQLLRDPSRSPLYQVAIAWDRSHQSKGQVSLMDSDGLIVESITPESKGAAFDLVLTIFNVTGPLKGIWKYNTDLFNADTIERMADHFQTLLAGIVANPHQPISQLPLLTEPEQRQLLVEWNDTQVEYPTDKRIHQLFEEHAQRTPNAVAVVYENQQLTYDELNCRANQLAQHLRFLGVKADVLVGICVERSIEMVVELLGILKAGGAYVPLDPSYPQERLSYMLADSGIEVLLTHRSLLESLPSHTARVVCLDSDWGTIQQHSQDNLDVRLCSDNLAYVIYTSGSTGQPKGVMIEHRSLCNLAQAQRNLFDVEPTSRVLQFASVSFDASVWEIFMAVTSGATLILATASELMPGDDLKQTLHQSRVTHITLPPSALAVLPTDELPALGQIIVAGEACPLELAKQWSVDRRFFNAYGPTESTVCSTVRQISDSSEKITIGRPISNTQIYILDSHLQPVPIGVAGELYIGGDGLARGYLNRPELTQEKFILNPFSDLKSERLYKTGDLARYLSDGNIEFLGRIDQQVKVRGFRIEVGEIEAVLNTYLQIEQAVVIATEDISGNKRLVAYVVTSDESLTTKKLREFLKQKLPEYMVPSAFVMLDTLPLTPNGKIDRLALPAPRGESTREHEYVAPRTAIEQILTNIWQELLLFEKVSINDNFFEIGGDSILSIQVVSRAKNLGIQITPKQIFQNQTIAELARVANTTVSVSAQQGIVTGVASLTPIQHWFFAQNREEAHHYNQSVLLQIPNHLQSELIETAFKKLLEHHDALRLRFRSQASKHKQINHGFDDTVQFTVVDLSSTPRLLQPQALSKITTEFQASLNLSTGPIMQVVMFNLGSRRDARLLIIIHHLAVDGVSWRILFSDLETIYQQLIAQQPIQLSAKTTAFIDWAEKLNNYAQSEILKQELDYWLNQPWSKTTSLPLDYAHTQQENTVGSAITLSVKLSVEETCTLLGAVNEAYNTQINDILLSALVLSLAKWTGNSTVVIDLEGHGREELLEDVDLSRTVGWFTSLFPVLLQLPSLDQPASLIKSIKEQLRAIPNRGIGYGILRYLCEDTTVHEQLQTIPTPEISFNYLGQFDQVQSETGWKFAPESTVANQSSKQTRDHLLDINALVVEGELLFDWTYSSHVHTHATVGNLAQSYLQAIRSIIEHCQSEDAFGYTPSDFPDAQLNQLELDELLAPIKTKNIESIYPLSSMQQGMLFHSLSAPGSGVYFEQMTLSLKANVNIAAFEKAWQRVVDRHSVLRTFFVWENRQTLLQLVLKQVNLPWNNFDWQELSPTEQQQQLKEFLQTQTEQGFQFNQAPLMGCTLIKLSEDTYKFIWSHHHILIDGWCLPIIFKDVLSFYEAELGGETCYLPTPRPYRDYIAWLNSQDKEAATEFWRQTLQGFSAPSPLVVDKLHYQNQQQQDSDYKELELRLSVQVSRKLQFVAQKQHVTFSTILQAAWALLLSRYSGEKDVVFGVTVSGRTASLSGVENMVGLFINTLPLRLQISPQQQLIPWLEQIQQLMLELQHYSYTPLVEIQAKSEVPGGIPLFESIVVFENYPIDSSLLSEGALLQLSEIKGFEHTNYPLTVVAVPGDELLVKISYNTVRFEEDTIGRMLGHLQTIFSAIVDNPQQAVGELPLLSEAERHQLLREWNKTATDYPTDKCIHQLFEELVKKTPLSVAVVFENQQLTYLQLNQRANQLAHHLQSKGVGPEVLVGICVERSIEMVVGLLGILKAGGAYVPLDPSYPQERLSYMLADSGVEVLLTHRSLLESLPSHTARVVCLDSDWGTIQQHSQDNLDVRLCSDNLAYVIYTSGSTGQPKGVMIEHRSLCNLAQAQRNLFDVEPTSRVLQFASVSFDASVWEIFMAVTSGATLILATASELMPGDDLKQTLHQSRVTHITLPPSALAVLPTDELPALGQIIVAGEACPLELAKQWSVDRRFFNAYGPTESTVCSTVRQISDSSEKITIGRPISNTQIYILDSHLQPVPIGVAGELYIGGDGLARGYLNRPELTQEKFIPNPFSTDRHSRLYKTGDQARYLPNGNIEYLGRIDHQVKIRGFRIELGEIEAVLSQHPSVYSVVVTARVDTPGEQRLVAYIVPQLPTVPTIRELRQFLKTKLPEYMVANAFVILEALPLTPNGKVDRRALPAPQLQRELLDKFVAPRTPIEEMLALIWAQVLRVEQVGIHDNFFELGGDSILSIQIVARANTAGLQLTTKQLFQHQTIAKLAAVAGTTAIAQAEQGLVTGPLPLTPIQHWFFNQNFPNPAHWNQAYLLEVQPDINPSIIEQVVQQLSVHHDALRLRFESTNSAWQQINTGVDDTVVLNRVDLSAVPKPEQKSHIEAAAAYLQASLNLKHGPLVRLAWFFLGEHQSNRLLIVIHHLAVDGVSWRILLEDLQTVYQQLSRGEAIQLPSKTTSFKHWAQLLSEYAQSSALDSELAYWLTKSDKQIVSIPVDYLNGVNIEASARTVLVTLSVEYTTALLQEVPKAYNTQINDVLLTALVQVLAQGTGSSSILFNLEGHGREEIFEGVNLSRTVGWFTTIFPVLLQLKATDNPGTALKSIKEQLRRIPNRGIGYGLLRYLKGNAEIASKLEALPQAQVSFNYLGQFDQVLYTASMFQPATESSEPSHSPKANRSHLLEVNGLVVQGQLQVHWTYSDNVHKHSTIESLAQKFLQALQTLIVHCSSLQAGSFSASDFPEANLSQEKIDQFLEKLNQRSK